MKKGERRDQEARRAACRAGLESDTYTVDGSTLHAGGRSYELCVDGGALRYRELDDPPLEPGVYTLRRSLRGARPSILGVMAGYSGTPLPKKLGIREGTRVALLAAPDGFDATLGALPGGASVQRDLRGSSPIDVALLFTKGRADLEKRFTKARDRIAKNGGLWVCWPKKSSGVATDLTEDVARAIGLAAGLVDNKVCAVDETWSGLRFVWRTKDR